MRYSTVSFTSQLFILTVKQAFISSAAVLKVGNAGSITFNDQAFFHFTPFLTQNTTYCNHE
jgi:hypothetical protein